MCGIVGYINFSKPFKEQVIEQMVDALHHRGPDDYGTKQFVNSKFQLALGHKRLSILDVSEGGHQPMNYKHLWITYNGEVYNFKAIRLTLKSKGHQFITETDTEVILHAFDEWGHKAVNHFIGMFVFVLYNEKENKFHIYRDRAGVKPLYYYEDKNDSIFMFASELKAFHKNPLFKKEIDVNAMAQFFKYEFIQAPNSIFRNVKKLLPGHFLTYNINKKSISTHKYWSVIDYYKKPRLKVSYEDAKSHLKTLIKDAFNLRMVSDVPVGVFLSGGYDSSLVTAVIQKDMKPKLKTFTIGFNNTALDESKYAQQVAEILKTDHNNFTCTDIEALDIIPKLADYFDEPFADPSLIPTMLLSQKTKEQVTVSLSADGGDEIFFGYNSYEMIYNHYSKTKYLGVFSTLKDYFRKNEFIDKFHRVNSSHKKAIPKLLDVYHQKYKDSFIQSVFSKRIEALPTNFTSNAFNDIKEFKKMLAIDYMTYMSDNILVKVDRATMSASLEGREPLLDHRIVEYTAQLPLDYLFDPVTKTKKHILRDICHDYLPKKIMDRPKTGFTPPILDWLRNELKPFTESMISVEALDEHGLLKTDKIVYALKEFFDGNNKYYNLIWNTLVFQIWYKKWMKDE